MNDEAKNTIGLEWIQAVWSRRKWIALLVFVLPLAAATSMILTLPNLYRSTATVLVERQQVPESFVKSTVTSEIDTRLRTISQEILSRSKLESLISSLNLYPDLRKRLSNEEMLDRMRRDIQLETKSTDTRGQSATISFALSYRGPDPETVARVTNTLVSFYIQENLKARERQASGTTEFLNAQLIQTKKRLDEQERRVSEFKKRYLGELPQQMQANLASLDALNTQLRLNSDNQVRAVERRDTITIQIAEAESMGPAFAPPAGGPTHGPEPPAVHLTRLKQELTAARARYTDAHPTVTRLKDEIAEVERDLANSKPESTPEAAPAPVAPPSQYVLRLREALRAAEAELKILKGEEQRLRSAIVVYQARVENTPRREQEFQDASRDLDSTKELYHSLLKRHEEAQLSENMELRRKGEQFRVLDRALPSAVTVAPNRSRLLLMALALSASLAVGVVLLIEMLDTSFHSADQLRAFTAIPVLVSISRMLTEAHQRRRRLRVRLAAAGALLGLILVVGVSYLVAHGNEQLVRMLDRAS